MVIYLHNPTSRAHLEDLRDRLTTQLARTSERAAVCPEDAVLIDRLVEVVQAMEQGKITARDTFKVFGRHRIPGFSFGRWFVEMVDEGIYLEEIYNEAA